MQLRGFRVELGAVDAAIARHASVRQCATVLREDEPGDPRLVTYVVPDAPAGVDASELRSWLAAELPEHAIPAAFVALEAIPLTPNGKLDRRALPAPEFETEDEDREMPRNPLEELVANLFADVLNRQSVGRSRNFFHLGGHSLLAARVVARLNSQYRVEMPLRTLFEAPTPAQLAVRLERLLKNRGEDDYLPIRPVDRAQPPSLSFAQERLWYLHQLAPEITAFNLMGAVEFRGALNVQALEEALDGIVQRHETLRTHIGLSGGWPVQVVTQASGTPLEIVDLPESTPADALTARMVEEVRRPIDLEAGPLFRTLLYRLSPRRSVFLIICHHIVTDGWSLGVFVRELCERYARIDAGKNPALPPLPVQYVDYAAWQREWLAGTRRESLLEFWRSRLDGAPAYIDLPSDRPRPPQFSYRGKRLGFELPAELRDRLHALSRSEGATLFMTLLAAFELLLARYSGQDDIVIGTPIANRDRPELEDMIGFFANTLVLRNKVSGTQTFRELLADVRSVVGSTGVGQKGAFAGGIVIQHFQAERLLDPVVYRQAVLG